MMNQVTITAQIPAALDDQLSRLAHESGRDRSSLIEEAIRGYIAAEMGMLAAIDEGLRAAESGAVIAHEAVTAIMAVRRQRLLHSPERRPTAH